jgi:hypothetical protein
MRLNDLPKTTRREGRLNVGVVADRRTGMSAEITSEEPLASYEVDTERWPKDTKRPDGLVATEGWIAFVELKGAADWEKSVQQLEAGIRHFAPDGPSGRSLHAGFAREEDLPRPPKGRVRPNTEHAVLAVSLANRAGTRREPIEQVVAGKTVRFVMLQRHFARNTCRLAAAEFEALLTPPP